MAAVKSMERTSSFAMACSLLSRYVKQNGAAAGELGLGIRAETDAQKTPAMMNLLPGAGAEAENGEARKETMELFPQNAGFGPGSPDTREQEKQQLTIFYGGKVLVFNDFPAEKAKNLMQMAGKGASAVQSSGLLPSSTTATVTDITKVSAMPAPSAAVAVNAQKNASDIPQAPKASLRRFLEKRKDRLNAKAPYQASPSDAKPVKEMLESQPWLGLSRPELSLGRDCSQ